MKKEISLSLVNIPSSEFLKIVTDARRGYFDALLKLSYYEITPYQNGVIRDQLLLKYVEHGTPRSPILDYRDSNSYYYLGAIARFNEKYTFCGKTILDFNNRDYNGYNESEISPPMELVHRNGFGMASLFLAQVQKDEKLKSNYLKTALTSEFGFAALPFVLLKNTITWDQVLKCDLKITDNTKKMQQLIGKLIELNASVALHDIIKSKNLSPLLPKDKDDPLLNIFIQIAKYFYDTAPEGLAKEEFLKDYENALQLMINAISVHSDGHFLMLPKLIFLTEQNFPKAKEKLAEGLEVEVTHCLTALGDNLPSAGLIAKLLDYAQRGNETAKKYLDSYFISQAPLWQKEALSGGLFNNTPFENLQLYSQNNPFVQYCLGKYYEEYTKEFALLGARYRGKARDCFKNAAERGVGDAYYSLGFSFENDPSSPNIELAIYNYYLALKANSVLVQVNKVFRNRCGDLKTLKKSAIANLYMAIYENIEPFKLQGSAEKFYGSSYLKDAFDKEKDQKAAISVVRSLGEDFSVHVKLVLFHVIYTQQLLPAQEVEQELFFYFERGLKAAKNDLKVATEFLDKLRHYVNSYLFAKWALATFYNEHKPLGDELRVLVMYFAEYLLVGTTNKLLPGIQLILQKLPSQYLETKRLLNELLPSAPPVELAETKIQDEVTEKKLTYADRLERIKFQGEIPNKFICPVNKTVMDRPTRLSDNKVYDESVISRLNGESPLTRDKLTGEQIFDGELYSKIKEFVETQERLAQLAQVDVPQLGASLSAALSPVTNMPPRPSDPDNISGLNIKNANM